MIREFDEDGDNQINLQEFIQLMARTDKNTDTEEELKSGFKQFDKDQDGVITFSDLKALMEELDEELSDEEI